MSAQLYIDGYNFYYGVTDYYRRQRDLRGYSLSGLCWCDFRALLERHFLRPGETLGVIKYFTAEVDENTAANPHERYNQHLWLTAVGSISQLEIIYGFHQKPDDRKGRQEKQTDVNIAVEMLLDAARKQAPSRIYLLSGDADYMPAILALEERLAARCPVTVLLPPAAHAAHYAERFRKSQCELRRREQNLHAPAPLDIKMLTEDILANSLLPYHLQCPPYWRLPDDYLAQHVTDSRYHPGRNVKHA